VSIERLKLYDSPAPLKRCPRCGAHPFQPFLRCQVGRSPRTLFSWPPFKLRAHLALICWGCKNIVGYESPDLPYIEVLG